MTFPSLFWWNLARGCTPCMPGHCVARECFPRILSGKTIRIPKLWTLPLDAIQQRGVRWITPLTTGTPPSTHHARPKLRRENQQSRGDVQSRRCLCTPRSNRWIPRSGRCSSSCARSFPTCPRRMPCASSSRGNLSCRRRQHSYRRTSTGARATHRAR